MTADDRVMLPRPGAAAETIPCHDHYSLFDSTSTLDHLLARRMCAACPMLRGCLTLAQSIADTEGWAGVPNGTWGGVLWRNGKRTTKPPPRRLPRGGDTT